MHLITGTMTNDGVRVLSRVEHVPYEKQSPVYVKLDEQCLHEELFTLDVVHGHAALAFFHSHTMRGAQNTEPSGEDRSHQSRFEAHYSLIGGIFSLDGFVRFFTNELPFTMDIYGAGMEALLDEPCMKLFRLPKTLR
jgi:hypothetical protein